MNDHRIEWDDVSVKKELRAATQAASFTAAEGVAVLARMFAPVGNRQYVARRGGKEWQSRRPGRLRRSIHAYRSKYPNGGAVVVAGGQVSFYARFVELGTPGTKRRVQKVSGKRDRNATRTPIQANPFMGKALKASAGRIREVVKDELDKVLAQ